MMQRCDDVMIVEDDPLARAVLQAYFASLDAKNIIEVENGEDALKALRSATAGVDLVVCDLKLPVMDGLQLLTHLSRLNFKGGVVIITGEHGSILNAAEEIAIAGNLKLIASLLKPLTKQKLDTAIGVEKFSLPQSAEVEEISPVRIERLLSDQSVLVHYQPIVDMQTGQVIGAEALARCLDPNRGVVPAKDIVPTAEQTGLSDELLNLMTLKVLGQLNIWRSQGLAISAGINVSAHQFLAEDFPDRVSATVKEFALDPSDVSIEVPEQGISQNLGNAMISIARLRLRGFGIAIDDCGTGSISFDRLKRLPATELKIDRTYVSAALTDEFAASRLREIIDIARTTNVQLVAKGIETQEEWDLMSACGIHAGQGYFIGQPMSTNEFEHWFIQRRDQLSPQNQCTPRGIAS